MRNNEIIEKAAMTLSDLASGGLMNTTQFNTFYRNVIDAPTIIKDARTVQMPIDSMKIEKIGFGQRVLRAGVEGVALTDAQRSKPTTSTITLNAKEVIAEVNITYDTLENNIEKDGLYNTIMQLLAERFALDAEELIINGDTALAATDPYLGLINGIRKKAVSHIVDVAGAPLTKNVFKKLYGAVPTKYLRNPREWKFYTSYANELEWKDSIVSRQTALGDSTLQGGLPNAYGVPVQGIAMLQSYSKTIETVAKQVNDGFLIHPKNILYGISRNVRVEVDRDIRERKFIIVLTAKMDVQFEEEDAVAKAIAISSALS